MWSPISSGSCTGELSEQHDLFRLTYALERALENGAECRSILQQIAAVRGASNGLMAEVLESHIRETFDQNDSYSHEVSKSVDDTIELVRTYLK